MIPWKILELQCFVSRLQSAVHFWPYLFSLLTQVYNWRSKAFRWFARSNWLSCSLHCRWICSMRLAEAGSSSWRRCTRCTRLIVRRKNCQIFFNSARLVRAYSQLESKRRKSSIFWNKDRQRIPWKKSTRYRRICLIWARLHVFYDGFQRYYLNVHF